MVERSIDGMVVSRQSTQAKRMRGSEYVREVRRPAGLRQPKLIDDFSGGAHAQPVVKGFSLAPKQAVQRTQPVRVAPTKQQRSQVVMRRAAQKPASTQSVVATKSVSHAPKVVTTTPPPQTPKEPSEKKKKKHNKKSIFLLILAVLLFVAGSIVAYQGWRANKQVIGQVQGASGNSSTNDSDEPAPEVEKPSSGSISSYAVAPTMPRYFKMPQFGIEKARILPMGVDSNNTLKSPVNIHDVGWYNASSLPGNAGAMLLDAHLSGWDTKGVFYKLKDLKAGDTVAVERGDGQEFTYKVVKLQYYDYKNVDMQAAITPITNGKPGMNMITCAGKVIPGTNEFDQRLIVFTEQV